MTNIAQEYPETKVDAIALIDSIIGISLSKEIRLYDLIRWKEFPFTGIKEHSDKSPILEFDIGAGVILFGLSPSATAFAIGSATYFEDWSFRNQLLKTA